MAPSEYTIRLQTGIEAGFAPPTPSKIYELSKESGDSNLTIVKRVREDGTPELGGAVTKSLDQSDQVSSLLDKLYDILKDLPTESPPGSEDIYGYDTSILWASEDLEWLNGSNSGIQGGNSDVQADSDQQKKFGRAMEIVEELVGMAE